MCRYSQALVAEPGQRLSLSLRDQLMRHPICDQVLLASADDVIWPWMRFHGNGKQAMMEPAGRRRLATT